MIPNKIPQNTRMMMKVSVRTDPGLISSGVSFQMWSLTDLQILPTSVSIPIPVTTRNTSVCDKASGIAIFVRSPKRNLAFNGICHFLHQDFLLSEHSSTFNLALSKDVRLQEYNLRIQHNDISDCYFCRWNRNNTSVNAILLPPVRRAFQTGFSDCSAFTVCTVQESH